MTFEQKIIKPNSSNDIILPAIAQRLLSKGEIVGGVCMKTGKTKQNMIYLEY